LTAKSGEFSTATNTWKVLTYIACEGRTSPNDLPIYTWYHEFMIRGAKENNFPINYQELIQKMDKKDDPDLKRSEENMKIAF